LATWLSWIARPPPVTWFLVNVATPGSIPASPPTRTGPATAASGWSFARAGGL